MRKHNDYRLCLGTDGAVGTIPEVVANHQQRNAKSQRYGDHSRCAADWDKSKRLPGSDQHIGFQRVISGTT